MVYNLTERRQVRLTRKQMDAFEDLCARFEIRPGAQLRRLVLKWISDNRETLYRIPLKGLAENLAKEKGERDERGFDQTYSKAGNVGAGAGELDDPAPWE